MLTSSIHIFTHVQYVHMVQCNVGSRLAGGRQVYRGEHYLSLPDFLDLPKIYLWIMDQTYGQWPSSFYDFVDKNYNYGCQRLWALNVLFW